LAWPKLRNELGVRETVDLRKEHHVGEGRGREAMTTRRRDDGPVANSPLYVPVSFVVIIKAPNPETDRLGSATTSRMLLMECRQEEK
jgi:hypothetical protein